MLRWVLSTVRNLGGLGGVPHTRCYSVALKPCRDNVTPIVASHRTPNRRSGQDPVPNAASHAIRTLSEHLSSDNWSKLDALPSGVNPKNLYHSAKRMRQLQLSKDSFQRLLALYGKLAANHDQRYANRQSPKDRPGYWSFVVEVGRDMEMQHELAREDREWLLRAFLAKLDASPSKQTIRHAEQAYEALKSCRGTISLDVHILFLGSMLQHGIVGHLFRHVLYVLETQSILSDEFVDLFWRIITETSVSHADRAHLMDMLYTRISKFKGADSHVRRSHAVADRIFDQVSRKYFPSPVSLDHLRVALGTTVFANLHASVPLSIQQWADAQAKKALCPTLSAEERWQSFAAFALAEAPSHVIERLQSSISDCPPPHAIVWRAVFMLRTMEKLSGEFEEDTMNTLREVVRTIWQQYQEVAKDPSEGARLVDRAVVASILLLSRRFEDSLILDSIQVYLRSRRLWDVADGYTRRERLQIHSLAADYLLVSVHLGCMRLNDILPFLNVAALKPQRVQIIELILRRTIVDDLEITYTIYLRCLAAGLRLSDELMYAIAGQLLQVQPLAVLQLLHDARLSKPANNRLLRRLLDTLYRQSIRKVPSSLGRVLARFIGFFVKVREDRRPFQFAICVVARSGHPEAAVTLVEGLVRTDPSMFHPTFGLHLGQILLDQQRYKLAYRLWAAMGGQDEKSDVRFRRKLVVAMAHGRAYALARRVFRSRHADLRERMLQRVRFRVDGANRLESSRVIALAARKPHHVPTITMAIRILANSKRPVAAMRLYASSLGNMNERARTYIGNILIHRAMHMPGTKNGRLVRRVLDDRRYLARQYGFVDDRVTFNIIVKAVLRWKKAVTAEKLRALFDHIIRLGYPWGQGSGTPFATPPDLAIRWPLPHLQTPIDFERHVEPLYKMFVTAFYLRGDKPAARLVLRILKSEMEARR